VVTQPDLVF